MKRLFTNGKIFTSDRKALYADAMLVEDGHILWIGNQQETSSGSAGTDILADEEINLKGRTVIPGFVDAHMHPLMLAEYSRQIACLPPGINSIRELTEEIARVAQFTPEGGWIRGWGYDEGKYEENRPLTRYDLDKGCNDRPVFLIRSCEHIRCVNSKALELAGITKDTPDPPGGSIDRDENGEPTGILRENARDLLLPYMPSETEAEIVDALIELGKLLASQGIVAVADMGNLHPGGNYDYYAIAAEKGFKQRVTMYYMWDYFMGNPYFTITEEDMDPGRQLRIAGIKLIGDGSISGRTAWTEKPYLGTQDYGMPVYSQDSLERALAFARKTGCQISVHAMGGRAIDRIIARIKCEHDWTDGKSPYLRIEHVTEPSEDAMETAAAKGFAFASQPIFEYCEIETYKSVMDEERLKTIYPYRTALEKGVKLCLSTDAPATSWDVPSDPFPNLKSAVARRAYDGTDIGQDERLDIETAVILYTKEAAEVCGFGNQGMLKAGYRGDFTVLSEDLFAIEPSRIDQVQIEETYIGGALVYKSQAR